MFLIAGVVMVLVAVGAFFTRSYRRISTHYLEQGHERVLLTTEFDAPGRSGFSD